MELNKKIYNDSGVFKTIFIEEYCNLKIYPLVGILEREAGILSDLAEAFNLENKKCEITIHGEDSEDIHFLKDNLFNFESSGNILFQYISDSTQIYELLDADVIFCQSQGQLHGYTAVPFSPTKVLYIKDHQLFNKHFWYYLDNGKFNYDNLICYTMIIKNGGPLLETVLTENLPFIDRWCIIDTGSTDGTQDVIRRVLKNKKGKLYEEPFVDFKVSRNRCLELAGKTCKFTLMLDDTYSMRGDIREFLNTVRGDQFSDSFSLLIQSDDTEYYSNRIVKTKTELRYIHTIHEVITDKNNINVTVPKDKAIIFDHRADYMEKRTNDRKQFDLQLLFKEIEDDPDDPRALYYVAQTYGCIGDELNKAKFFELRINHPVQGYVQEKIDACFELARTYNFKVDPLTKEFYKIEQPRLSSEQWDICKRLYEQAYELDKKRPDSVYFIGIRYYLEGDYKTAYTYFKKGFEIGYPIYSQYSLKPTLSFYFLPKFLAEVSYYVGDYVTGFNASVFFLQNNKENCESWNLMVNWHEIHRNLTLMGPVAQNPVKLENVFCIVTDGGWEPWTGKDILTKGLGGSETWIIETARNLKNFNVMVFCKCEKPEMFENVGYNPIENFNNFIANNVVKYCIISRYTQYIPVALNGHAENVGLIFHDTLSPELIIPKHPKLKWIFGLTDWHCDLIKRTFPQFKEIIFTQNYGINKSFNKIKIKNSFIYSSFPNRGLVVLLQMWPRIKKLLPDAVLNIYCDLDHEWSNKIAPDEMKLIKTLIKVNKNGINSHGWVSKETLNSAWKTAEYWLYPCKFEETFCLTAVEAAITGTLAITNNLAALGETVGNRGLIVHGNVLTQEWQDTVMEKLTNLDQEFKKKRIEENYQWAMERSWKSQTIKFEKIITQFVKYWDRNEEINNYLLKQTKDLESVVNIGSVNCSFENANITIDNLHECTHKINIEESELPHSNYDFIYCRHLLEDLKKPELLLSEIKKKAKAGYIETPSVYAECCKAIDFDNNINQIGYAHHNFMLWTDNKTLFILPKVKEFIKDIDQKLLRSHLQDPFVWNNYYLFNELNYIILSYSSKEEYLQLLQRAFEVTLINTRFIQNYTIKNIPKTDNDHGNMLNWTHDVPQGTRTSFETTLKKLEKGAKLLEVGTFVGTGLVEMLNIVPDSTAVVIDPWENYDEHDNTLGIQTQVKVAEFAESTFYKNTIHMKDRITVMKGKSSDKLLELFMKQVLFNFIYIDGSHRCLDVYFDATIAWKLLKIGGVLAFDDYLFNKGDILNSPHDAVNYFLETIKEKYVLLHKGYRLFIKKIN